MGDNSEFFQVVATSIFPQGVNSGEILFYSKLRENHFSDKKLMGKYQISKS